MRVLEANQLTGTFFCESTTAQVLPLTPTEVIFAAVMALKAYSVAKVSEGSWASHGGEGVQFQASILQRARWGSQTNLIKSPSIREYGDVSIGACTT